MNYKDTLNILKTNFEMKANLNKKEPEIQRFWDEHQIYQKLLKNRKDNKQWILHDGPPYANGDIHVGHSLNKTIKDIIVRQHWLCGFYSPYIPGWDTHGLPIEHALLKKGINKDPNLTVAQKRENCRKFAIDNVNKQLIQFKRLGLLTDFQDKYLTLTNDYVVRQLKLFAAIVKKGLVYQDLKPIYWSWSSHTALAEAEIEYADVKAPSIYVTFKVVQGNNHVDSNDELIIWTTTPWTIPCNQAIAANPDFNYVKVVVNNKSYVVGQSRLESLAKEFNWDNYKVVSEFKGKDLEGIKYQHCLYNKQNPVILAKYVSDENGTCLVHNASGFGTDDYLACKAYGINVYCPIDDHGKYTADINDEKLVGVFYEQANEGLIQRMQENNCLLKLDYFMHSVAIDWRTKKPVMYRATKQWFINIDSVKSDILNSIENVKFNNQSNKNQLVSMITNRKEWCISRQRVWGVPIPIIFDAQNKPIYDDELIQNIINIFAKEGSDVWFEKPASYFLTKKYQAINQIYTKEKDIMDVWFDSGSSFTMLKEKQLNYPADLYFEGNDQYRGWFNSSIINSVILNNTAPYKQLLSHGFTLDEQGRKMSKSLGNVIDPLKVCSEFGADVLRLWCASVDYSEDMKISKNILTQIAEVYRRIRNTLFKFSLANISDFDYSKNKSTDFDPYDKYVLNQLKSNLIKIDEAYKSFDFSTVIKTINLHVIDLSSSYFDVIKDVLYCEKVDSSRRRAIQTVLFTLLKSYLIVLTPIIPHTCEEVYSFFNLPNKKESVMFENWINSIEFDCSIDQSQWDEFLALKKAIYSELEIARANKLINKNNEAKVILTNTKNLPFDLPTFKKYLNVALVEFSQGDKLTIKIENSGLVKCQRCWNYFSKEEMHNEEICERCYKVLE